MAAAKSALGGDLAAMENLLVGRRIWVVIPDDKEHKMPGHVYDCRVVSFGGFYPAGDVAEGQPASRGGVRKKHLVKVWTDPGGTRVLSVGSIRLKDPGRVKAGLAAQA